MDPLTVVVDVVSVAVFAFALFFGSKAIRAFRQSKQAVTESASLINVVVHALSSRMEISESVANQLRTGFEAINERNTAIEDEQTKLRSAYLQLLNHLREILSNDKRLILELEQLKTRLSSIKGHSLPGDAPTSRERAELPVGDENILASLTQTERETVEILAREGPKAAPELGRRLKKSREHMSRLMKKLYFEGYVDRESNHAPFRYKLNERVRSNLRSASQSIIQKASGPA